MRIIIYRIYVFLFANCKSLRFNRLIITLGLNGIGVNNYGSLILTGKKYPSSTIFDVEAHDVGYAQFYINDRIKNIFCFEPVPVTYDRLSKGFASNNSIKCFNIGLSDKHETIKIYDERKDETVHASIYPGTLNNSEGYKYSIVQGAGKMLKSNSKDIIQFEFNKHNIFSAKFLRNFKVLLNNYQLYRMLLKGILPIMYNRSEMEEFFFMQNIVAIRSDINPF